MIMFSILVLYFREIKVTEASFNGGIRKFRHNHHATSSATLRSDRKARSSVLMSSDGKNRTYEWPDKRVAEIDGDIVIGGLHMVHEREDTQLTCGPIMPQGGLQAAEVMLFTVDRVNALGIMPKGVTLGTYILDDCDKDTYGLQQAVDFIKGRYMYVAKKHFTSLPELKNSMDFSYFTKPEPEKNPIFKDCQNPNSKETQKLKLDQIQF